MDHTTSKAVATAELTAMSERDLQVQVVEPLLREMGFKNVYDSSGPNERGKDLIATKENEFGQLALYAIQIKRLRPSRKQGAADSFGRLLDQLRSALLEPVFDPA